MLVSEDNVTNVDFSSCVGVLCAHVSQSPVESFTNVCMLWVLTPCLIHQQGQAIGQKNQIHLTAMVMHTIMV